MASTDIPKARLIRQRLKPVCKGVFEEFVFEDSQEYINELIAKEKKRQEEEKRKKEEAARKAAEEAAIAAKKKADETAKKKAEEEAAKKKAADEAAAKKKAEEEAKKNTQKLDGIPDNVSNYAQKEAARLDEPDGEPIIKPKPWTAPKWKLDPKFDHKTSIFAEFNVDDEDDLKKMFEYDMNNSRLSKFYSEKSDFEKSKQMIWESGYYYRLVDIFRYYQALSNFPRVGANDTRNLFQDAGVFDKNFTTAQFDNLYIDVNQDNSGDGKKQDRELCRFEFIELILRAAVIKYKLSGVYKRHREAIVKFLEDHIFPKAKTSQYEYNGMRFEHIYTVDVNKALVKYKSDIDKLFQKVGGKDGVIESQEAIKMVRDAKLTQVSNREAVWCFAHAQQVCIDEAKGGYSRMGRMEFYEFLVRVALKQYEGEKGDVDDKVSALLKVLLK